MQRACIVKRGLFFGTAIVAAAAAGLLVGNRLSDHKPERCGKWVAIGDQLHGCQLYRLTCAESLSCGEQVSMVCDGRVMK